MPALQNKAIRDKSRHPFAELFGSYRLIALACPTTGLNTYILPTRNSNPNQFPRHQALRTTTLLISMRKLAFHEIHLSRL